MAEASWPPRSAHAALLSSPDGRKRFERNQDRRNRSLSPSKRSTPLPTLGGTSHKLFDGGEDGNDVDESEEDEETLQLKLAAIEAKLKLKKLQQSRGKVVAEGSTRKPQPSIRSPVRVGSSSVSRATFKSDQSGSRDVEVPVSPTRRTIPQAEQRSPGRILLGIDKGLKGNDVSLRRARSLRDSKAAGHERPDRGIGAGGSTVPGLQFGRPLASARGDEHPTKTFSQKIAQGRVEEQIQAERQERIASKRAIGFALNHAELKGFQKAAAEADTHNPPRSPQKVRDHTNFSRDQILRSQHETRPQSRCSARSHTSANLHAGKREPPSLTGTAVQGTDRLNHGNASVDRGQPTQAATIPNKGDPALYDPFSQLHLTSRIVPHPFLERTFPNETHACIRLPQLLAQVTAPAYELPGLDTKDIVIVGVIAAKSTPLDHRHPKGADAANTLQNGKEVEKKWQDGSQNQQKFMVLQLSDLKWTVDLFLFGTALPRYHRLTPGSVVAISNPGIMPPKKGKEDTGAFSLTLHHGEDTILEIGTARDLGFCDATKKDGKKCGSWVNLTKTEVCEWHLNAQIKKTQAGRMGVNTGSNAIGRDVAGTKSNNAPTAGRRFEKGSKTGLLPRTQGMRYDGDSESLYFMSYAGDSRNRGKSNQARKSFNRSAASLLESDDDDPFVAEGRLSRDKDKRLKARFLNEEKEREISHKLTSMGSGGAGGEYLRHRITPKPATGDSGSTTIDGDGAGRAQSAVATKDRIMGAGVITGGKRAADSVRLSPMKKTRFLTERGVRDLGKKSSGGRLVEQDDDLEIV